MAQHLSTTLISALVIVGLISEAGAFSCTEALTEVLPCQSFLIGDGAATVACCNGVSALRHAAARQSNKKAICRCLRQAAVAAKVDPNKVEILQHFCGVKFPLISPGFDCNDASLYLS